jgi:hypothetical protein
MMFGLERPSIGNVSYFLFREKMFHILLHIFFSETKISKLPICVDGFFQDASCK